MYPRVGAGARTQGQEESKAERTVRLGGCTWSVKVVPKPQFVMLHYVPKTAIVILHYCKYVIQASFALLYNCKYVLREKLALQCYCKYVIRQKFVILHYCNTVICNTREICITVNM